MNSGVGVKLSDELVQNFTEFKLRGTSRWITLHIENNTVVEEKRGVRESSYADFVAVLPSNAPRYGLYNYSYQTEEGARSKTCLVFWCPDGANLKSKTIYAATKGQLKQALQGISVELQASNIAEIDEAELLSKCKQMFR
jgi:cofilin